VRCVGPRSSPARATRTPGAADLTSLESTPWDSELRTANKPPAPLADARPPFAGNVLRSQEQRAVHEPQERAGGAGRPPQLLAGARDAFGRAAALQVPAAPRGEACLRHEAGSRLSRPLRPS